MELVQILYLAQYPEILLAYVRHACKKRWGVVLVTTTQDVCADGVNQHLVIKLTAQTGGIFCQFSPKQSEG